MRVLIVSVAILYLILNIQSVSGLFEFLLFPYINSGQINREISLERARNFRQLLEISNRERRDFDKKLNGLQRRYTLQIRNLLASLARDENNIVRRMQNAPLECRKIEEVREYVRISREALTEQQRRDIVREIKATPQVARIYENFVTNDQDIRRELAKCRPGFTNCVIDRTAFIDIRQSMITTRQDVQRVLRNANNAINITDNGGMNNFLQELRQCLNNNNQLWY